MRLTFPVAILAAILIAMTTTSEARAQQPTVVGTWASQADPSCRLRISEAAENEEHFPNNMKVYVVVSRGSPNCTWAAAGMGDQSLFSAGFRKFDNGLNTNSTTGPLFIWFKVEGVNTLVMDSLNLDGSHRSGERLTRQGF
jgi:hypothetical protein